MRLPSLKYDWFSNTMTRPETCTHHLQAMAVIAMQFTMVIKFPVILFSLPLVLHKIKTIFIITDWIARIYDASEVCSCSLHPINQHWLDRWHQILLENEHFALIRFDVLASVALRGSMFFEKRTCNFKLLYERRNKYTKSILPFKLQGCFWFRPTKTVNAIKQIGLRVKRNWIF